MHGIPELLLLVAALISVFAAAGGALLPMRLILVIALGSTAWLLSILVVLASGGFEFAALLQIAGAGSLLCIPLICLATLLGGAVRNFSDRMVKWHG